MTRTLPRSRLLAPLVYVVALVLLIEQWCWDAGARLGAALAAWLGRWAWVAAVEDRIRTLPPYAALCLFVLPGLLLLPVKLLAVVAIAHGHAVTGIATIVVAKLGGAAVVARLYALTLPMLLTIRWFARGYTWFMLVKARSLARLRASAAARLATRMTRTVRFKLKRMLRRGRGGLYVRRHRLLRLLRRFAWQWRARRRPSERRSP